MSVAREQLWDIVSKFSSLAERMAVLAEQTRSSRWTQDDVAWVRSALLDVNSETTTRAEP